MIYLLWLKSLMFKSTISFFPPHSFIERNMCLQGNISSCQFLFSNYKETLWSKQQQNFEPYTSPHTMGSHLNIKHNVNSHLLEILSITFNCSTTYNHVHCVEMGEKCFGVSGSRWDSMGGQGVVTGAGTQQ